jgi:hypothetical protein
LSFAPFSYPIEATPVSRTVLAPPQKLSALYQWAEAKIADIGISAGLAAAGTVALTGCATVVLCIIPGVLYAASALTGPVTDALFQNALTDPSPNYASLVQVESPPEYLATLPNNTYGKLAYYEFEYTAYLNASVESSVRGYGAEMAGNSTWANLQFSQAEVFAGNSSQYYNDFRLYLNQALNEQGPTNETAFENGLNYLRSHGLPLTTVQIRNATGTRGSFNSSFIFNLQDQPVNGTLISESLPNVGNDFESDATLQQTSLPPTHTQTVTQTTTNHVTPPSGSIWYWYMGAILAVAIVVAVALVRRARKPF